MRRTHRDLVPDERLATYQAVMPDGATVTGRTYDTKEDEAWLSAYKHAGHWFVTAVRDRKYEWPGQVWAPAKKIDAV